MTKKFNPPDYYSVGKKARIAKARRNKFVKELLDMIEKVEKEMDWYVYEDYLDDMLNEEPELKTWEDVLDFLESVFIDAAGAGGKNVIFWNKIRKMIERKIKKG